MGRAHSFRIIGEVVDCPLFAGFDILVAWDHGKRKRLEVSGGKWTCRFYGRSYQVVFRVEVLVYGRENLKIAGPHEKLHMRAY
jgi:hypothetical protein